MSHDSNHPPSGELHAPSSTPALFDITERAARDQVRREVIRLFRSTDLSPREILLRLMEQFYPSPVRDEDRRMFLRHATIWVREEALIRGAMAAERPNAHSALLEAFHFLDREDPEGARILELAYVAEIAPPEIAEALTLEQEAVAKKLQHIQSWIRRVAAGEPLKAYRDDPSRALRKLEH